VAADGTIRTGARRYRVPAVFEPVLADVVACAGESGASLYVYGSVANGTARPGSSDVDLLSVGLPDAAVLGERLSARYAGICRGVEFAAATAADLADESDAGYGLRVFLRHKTLLAVAGLVSVHDRTWTTDRARAVRRWGELEPGLAVQLGLLHSWAARQRRPSPGKPGARWPATASSPR
jgi:hypothetical protein